MKFYIFAAVSLVLLGSGCSSNKSSAFQKRQECTKYVASVEAKLAASDEKEGGRTFLTGVFYSSKLDSCFKAYHYSSVFVIRDALSEESLFFANGNAWERKQNEDAYNAKIQELKNE